MIDNPEKTTMSLTSTASYGRPKQVIIVLRFHIPTSTGRPMRHGRCYAKHGSSHSVLMRTGGETCAGRSALAAHAVTRSTRCEPTPGRNSSLQELQENIPFFTVLSDVQTLTLDRGWYTQSQRSVDHLQ